MGLCKLIVIVGVASIWMQSTKAASIGGQNNLCMCTREYFPICGTDGVTYSNKCVFECKKRTVKDLEVQFFGICDDQAADEVLCMCTREYEPICGTDGKTYSNKCTFKCAQKNNNALEFSSYGQCVEVSNLPMDSEFPEIHNLPMNGEIPEVQNYEVPCMCTREYNPVCGNDGKTYSNKCMLNCAKTTNKDLEMFASGECVEVSNLPMDGEMPEVQILPLDTVANEISNLPLDNGMCMCTYEYAPVCGTDGKTYANKCSFKCAQKTNKQLEVFAVGACDQIRNFPAEKQSEAMCMCTYEYSPLCGTDGKTYGNKCSFNCAQKTNKQLEVFSVGVCNQVRNFPVEKENEGLCICTREYEPICGSDGKTYSNKCMMKCEQQMKSDLKLEHYGEC